MKKLTLSALISATLAFTAPVAHAQPLQEAVLQDNDRLIEIFEHIHANPEVGFMEHATAAIVAKELSALGFEVHEGIAETGVAGVLKNGDGPVVMFRADMDALPIKEETNLAYKATGLTLDRHGNETPAMHACGHDAHTTWLIGMAKQLAASQSQWQGTMVLVAQPAEELIMGATAMVEDGLYNKVPVPDVLIAGHVHPLLPEGTVSVNHGRRMAGTDQIDVTIQGIGGHGSTPHATKDPVIMAAMSIMGYQTIVSRVVDQAEPAVLSVGAVQAGDSNNIIPDSATLKLNLRWYQQQERDAMIHGIKSVTDNVAQMYGMAADQMPTYVMKGYSTPLINPEAEAAIAKQAMIEAIGEDNVIKGLPSVMGSEDFHMLTTDYPDVPVVFVEVGAATQQTWNNFTATGAFPKFTNHNPNFVVEQGAIATGTTALTSVVLEFLKR
ncbi:amidohydrolase [Shewanella sp. Scap07]|uniref:amidohydrolase n=1 Tax=Shewanella sp. Scap07 TaxID=2589987 RepID=UPI0015C14859|nr:amidohydrolase [Shewanella sp. Scap07]QLE83712.1 amidohydrolase [Shewanella sp. Scap07]